VLGDSYVLRDEEHGAHPTRRGMIVSKGDQVVVYILISLQRIEQEEMGTLTSQWVGGHYKLMGRVLESTLLLWLRSSASGSEDNDSL